MTFPSMIPGQSYVDWRMHILSLLSQKEAAREFYWILDACAHKYLPGVLWRLETDPKARPLYMNTYREEVSAAGPFILPAAGNHAVTRWIFDEGWKHPLGCLAEIAPGSYELVFDHLQQQLECRLENDQPVLFRWFDPRILYGLSTYSEREDELAGFMGPVLHFHAWEPGRCCGIRYGTSRDAEEVHSEPQRCADELFDHIWNEAMIHSIIGTMGSSQGARLREMPLPEAYRLGEKVADVLSRAGYADRRSLAYGMSLTVRLGPYIWDEPRVVEALAERPRNAPLTEVLDEVGL